MPDSLANFVSTISKGEDKQLLDSFKKNPREAMTKFGISREIQAKILAGDSKAVIGALRPGRGGGLAAAGDNINVTIVVVVAP